MGLPLDNCGFWSKFGTDFQVNNSEIGSNMVWSRPGIYKSYTPVKFENGIELPEKHIGADALDYVRGIENFFDPNDFAVGIQIKPYWNLANGVASGSVHAYGNRHGYFSIGYNTGNTIAFVSFGSDIGFSVINIEVGGVYTSYIINTDFAFLANSINHLLLGYKQSGIDGGATRLILYLNKVEIFSSVVAPGVQVNTGGNLMFGAGYNTFANIQFSFWGGVDNPKIYGGVTGDLLGAINANNENEGWAVEYRITNKFNRILGIHAGRPL